MSLYYDAAAILSSTDQRGSLKGRIYAKDAALRSKPAHVYALISETAKYDVFLKEVIENSGILTTEPKLTPLVSLLLVHDHLFAKGGIAASAGHPLRQIVEKYKARLQSEFTRARLRRRAGTIDVLKKQLLAEKGSAGKVSPRWARVNTIKISCDSILTGAFSRYERVHSIEDVVSVDKSRSPIYIDEHIPNLLAFAPEEDLTKSQAYADGQIILQEKASCFPAYLLLDADSAADIKDVVDGCAAPGNKTTHTAAILAEHQVPHQIYACERDTIRSKTLQSMVSKAGADKQVTVLSKQDFLALDPTDERFASVTHLLLDPSCSGSGILGREDIPKLVLPKDPRADRSNAAGKPDQANSKKRKRVEPSNQSTSADDVLETDTTSESQVLVVDKSRLEKLSTLQSLIVEHAFSFPAARRITYSTCSIHIEENELVVERVLASVAGKRKGWRVLRRDEQVDGMRTWPQRGVESSGSGKAEKCHGLTDIERDACIRCRPNDEQGTMGFFVCGFIRDGNDGGSENGGGDDWEGFGDD